MVNSVLATSSFLVILKATTRPATLITNRMIVLIKSPMPDQKRPMAIVIPSRETTSTTSGSTRLIWKVWGKFLVDGCISLLVEKIMILVLAPPIIKLIKSTYHLRIFDIRLAHP